MDSKTQNAYDARCAHENPLPSTTGCIECTLEPDVPAYGQTLADLNGSGPDRDAAGEVEC